MVRLVNFCWYQLNFLVVKRYNWVSSTALLFTCLFPCFGQKYGSLDSIEPVKDILEKDQNGFDTSLVAAIDRTMKKHTDNLIHMLEGVGDRLTQLESRTSNLETSVDDLKMSVGNNHGSIDGKMRQLENILKEVFSFFWKSKRDFLKQSYGIWFCCGCCCWYVMQELDVYCLTC